MSNKKIKISFQKAKELWRNKEDWKSFGIDKRTAHYKSTMKIRKDGGDKYFTLKTWIENAYDWDNNPILDFYWERSLVHYKDGSFKVCKFRQNRKIKRGKK